MQTTATKLKFTAQQEDLLVLRHLANIAKASSINPILQYVNLEPISNTYRDWETDRKSTRLNSSHSGESRMPSSA